jgi:hypothetical protein
MGPLPNLGQDTTGRFVEFLINILIALEELKTRKAAT